MKNTFCNELKNKLIKEKIRNLILNIYEGHDTVDEEDGRNISENEAWKNSKSRVMESLENGDEDYALIDFCKEDEPEQFEEAREETIRFINEEL